LTLYILSVASISVMLADSTCIHMNTHTHTHTHTHIDSVYCDSETQPGLNSPRWKMNHLLSG